MRQCSRAWRLTSAKARPPRILTCFTWPVYPGLQSVSKLNFYVFFCVLLLLANVEQVNRIVIAIQSGELMLEVGAFPCLRDRTVQKGVRLVRPHVLDVSRASIPRVVKNGVLKVTIISVRSMQYLLGLTHWLIPRHLNLGVLPPRNLNDDVDDLPVILIRPCWNVVPK